MDPKKKTVMMVHPHAHLSSDFLACVSPAHIVPLLMLPPLDPFLYGLHGPTSHLAAQLTRQLGSAVLKQFTVYL